VGHHGQVDTSNDSSKTRRHELATFLRSRRERITPEDVGLPPGSRRRTPGLRREEVAQLAGVGVTWYTWLEQGRDINASAQVLEAVARTLRMDHQERQHLFRLAGIAPLAADAECAMLPGHMQDVLDQLSPFPALVSSPRFDLLAYNRAYNYLVDDVDRIPAEERNLIWLFFTHPAWHRVCEGWDAAGNHLVAQLRSSMATHLDDPLWTELVDRLLAASAEFAQRWERHDVTAGAIPVKRFRNPLVGELQLNATKLWLGRAGVAQLTTYSPADAETRLRLERLVEQAPAAALATVAAS
jgi:transcriptional regulator with XRE-family HTH domain